MKSDSNILATKFEHDDVEFLIEDIVSEKLFQYKVGKPIDVFVNLADPAKSTVLGNYSTSEFIGNFIAQFVVLIMLLVFLIIRNY